MRTCIREKMFAPDILAHVGEPMFVGTLSSDKIHHEASGLGVEQKRI